MSISPSRSLIHIRLKELTQEATQATSLILEYLLSLQLGIRFAFAAARHQLAARSQPGPTTYNLSKPLRGTTSEYWYVCLHDCIPPSYALIRRQVPPFDLLGQVQHRRSILLADFCLDLYFFFPSSRALYWTMHGRLLMHRPVLGSRYRALVGQRIT